MRLTSCIGEGHFETSGAATPIGAGEDVPKGKKPRKNAAAGGGKKAKTAKQRLAMADGDVDMG